METKDTLSSHSDLNEQEIQQLQMQAKILKENSMNKFNALKTTTQRLERQTFTNCPLFQRAFAHLFRNDVRTFKYELSQNMNNLEKKLNNEILHEKDSNSDLNVRANFKDYIQMKAQTFKETIIQDMDFIEQCIVERARREQEIQNSSRDTDSSGIVFDKGNDQSLENQSNTSEDESNMSRNECNDKITFGNDTDIRPFYDTEPMVEVSYTAEYNVFAVETQHPEQPENMNDTSLMEKVDSNTTLDSSDMCLVKEKNKVITDLKLKEEKDLDNLIAMEKQLKFLNEIVYKRSNHSYGISQTSTYNGRPTFANPMYLKKARSEKSCLYEIPYDTSDLANRFTLDREETLTLEQKSRSKLNKDLVKHYDYTKQTAVMKILNHQHRKYLISCDLDAHTELQCQYQHKIKECECLAEKLSKQTETVSKEVYNERLRNFAKLENHSISLILALQQFTPYSWPQVKKSSFAKPYDVNAPDPSRNRPKHKDKALNTKPSVHQSARLPNTANGNKTKPRNFNQRPRNWPPSMGSRVSNKTVNIAGPRNQKPFMKSKDLACPTCKKCIYNANHDECILKYLSQVGLKWIPIRNSVETRYNTNDSASPLGKETHNHKTVICANSSSLSAGTSKASEPISSQS
uniref:Uncharacterized protein n=1 Tax=Tanacetum cinerariifolium TaxID=118510 RepID=A0A6L2PBL3_TANCI|nr:hypothetical protein [Tanacetum cinerariifolium]